MVLQGAVLVPNGVENGHGLEKALVCIRLSYGVITGPQRPGIILSLLIILRLLIVQILLSTLTYIVSDSTLQHGWTDATQLLFMNTACSP